MNEVSYRDKFSLQGKIAVVTGGAGILGKHFCRGLAECGASVAVVDVNADYSVAVANEIVRDFNVPSIGVGCDVSLPDSVAEMTRRVIDEWGKIDILHNNAASKSSSLEAYLAPFEDFTIQAWREIMSVNIDGMFLVAQSIGKQMLSQGHGNIIQTASIYGIMAPDPRIYEGSFYMGQPISSPAVYAASKAAVVGLTKYLAAYWGDKGIRVNALTPGGVDSGQNDTFAQKYSARVPMRRMARADEMVGALLFLASDASSYINGHNIVVDGGLNAW